MKNIIPWRLWAAILLALLIGAATLVPGAAAQGSDAPRLTVIIEALNLRGGPDTTYPVIGLLVQGDEVSVVGHYSAGGWWQVKLPGGRTGWVSGQSSYVQVRGDVAGLPEVIAPVTSTSVTRPDMGQTGTIVFQTVSGGPIYVVNADGTGLRYLTTGTDPALSPDGQWVAFTRWETNQNGALGSLAIINIRW